MCGIFGQLYQPIKNFPATKLALEVRGRDNFGRYTNQDIDFLHARLAIIGLGEQGNGPMISADKRYVLTYNGEIYNYKTLREEIFKQGFHFQSMTDTEVLLNGFICYGEKIFNLIEGIYAFALWDCVEKRLYLGVDPFGIKPIYYGVKTIHTDGVEKRAWVFSSQIRPIVESKFFETLKIDSNGVESYLMSGSVQGEATIFESIRTIRPGNIYKIDNRGMHKIFEPKQFLCDSTKIVESLSLPKLKEKIISVVEQELMSEVPLGLFLSGGIDSSILALIMRKFGPVMAFSLGVESVQANKLAKKLDIKHYQYYLTQSDFNDSIQDFILSIDHPSIDGFNSYWVSKLASKNVKVALSGLGADEIFAGYPIFHHAYQWEKNRIPGLGYLPFGALSRMNLLKYAQNFSPKYFIETYSKYRKIDQKKKIQFLQEENNSSWPLLSQISLLEKNHYLFSMLLRDMDSLSMRHQVEVRVPFLNWDLWNSLLHLNNETKCETLTHHRMNKPLLVRAFQQEFEDIGFGAEFLALSKDKKKGFELPIGRWGKELFLSKAKEMKDFCATIGIDNKHYTMGYNKFLKDENNYRILWSYFVLMEYYKSFFPI